MLWIVSAVPNLRILRGKTTFTAYQMNTVDKTRDRVRRMFAQIAPRYDLMNHVLSLNIDKSWRNQTLRRLELAGHEPVLDVCTGTGDLAISIAKKASGRFQVIGADFCLPMLELAQKKLTDGDFQKETRACFIEADTQELPFPDDTFQAVTVAFGIRNVADTLNGLQEMVRVCQPGGQIAILEFSRPTWPVLKQLYDGYFRWILPAVGQALGGIANRHTATYPKASFSSHPVRRWSKSSKAPGFETFSHSQ